MIDKTIWRYRILSQFGGGGMNVVYEAADLKLHRHVALNWFEELRQKVPAGKK
jgi:hypothetical protein